MRPWEEKKHFFTQKTEKKTEKITDNEIWERRDENRKDNETRKKRISWERREDENKRQRMLRKKRLLNFREKRSEKLRREDENRREDNR